MKYILQLAADQTAKLPTKQHIQKVINLMSQNFALQNECVTLRVVTEEESQHLNQTYRDKNYPTNVLSFANQTDDSFILPDAAINSIGDLVFCHAVIAKEAEIQNKTLLEHYTHLMVHGILHLLGYDHELPEDALEMESLEITLLKELQIDNPYEERTHGK